MNNHCSDRQIVFVALAYAPTDCSLHSVKDDFYQKPHDPLRTARRSDTLICAVCVIPRVGRLLSNKATLRGPFGLHSYRSENVEQLLAFGSEHQLFLASTNFGLSGHRYASCPANADTKSMAPLQAAGGGAVFKIADRTIVLSPTPITRQ